MPLTEETKLPERANQHHSPVPWSPTTQADEPKMAVLVGATPALRLWTCECWASWELSFELH